MIVCFKEEKKINESKKKLINRVIYPNGSNKIVSLNKSIKFFLKKTVAITRRKEVLIKKIKITKISFKITQC